ncbi:MAG: hypothetical protein ACRCY3_14355 [Sphingorhabdus sp.]
MIDTTRLTNVSVLARLKTGPILVWIVGILFLIALVILKAGNPQGSLFYYVFGDFVVPIMLLCFAGGLASFVQMYRWRNAYLRHDSDTVYRGWWDSWPITTIMHVYIATNLLGIRSLRARIGAKDIELFKAYSAVEDVEEVLDRLKSLTGQ